MKKTGLKAQFDYSALGLKAGLEVHQQLNTGKLFCACPSRLIDREKPGVIFSRKLNLSFSEMGKVDRAALQEFEKKSSFEYHFFDDVNCLVEADEEPPHEINKEALKVALQVALMTQAGIFDEILVMRKIVIDGSNVSGFQRTALVAEDGFIKLNNKKVGIQSVVVEEDAGRKIEKIEDKVVYNLDRLGIPLIEFTSKPDLNSPEEVKECALKMGELLRRTCRCMRGLGTIRQDLNISIKTGARIELKGVQELDLIETFVEREVLRQVKLNELKGELKKRSIEKKDFEEAGVADLTNVFLKTQSTLVRKALEKKSSVFAFRLKGFKGLLGFELQPDKRFATELSDNIKVKTGLKGLLHSDELPAYGITEEEVSSVRKELECPSKDGFIIILGSKEKSLKGAEAVRMRILSAFEGVPEETRQASEDGNSSYLRPLASAERMYPETDLKPFAVKKELVEEIRKTLPLTVEEREKLYSSKGLSPKLVAEMKLNNYAVFFEELLKEGFNATASAVFLLQTLKEIERAGKNILVLNEGSIRKILEAEKKGIVLKENLRELAVAKINNPGKSIEGLVSSVQSSAGEGEIERIIERILSENKEFIEKQGARAVNALMGHAMKELKGKASAGKISELIKKKLDN